MPVMFKNIKGRALKEYRERDEGNEDLCARTFKVYKECVINNYITLRLEQLEHLYQEYTWEHQKHPEDFYDYEWVIHIYIEGIDEFIDNEYNIFEYDDSIIRIKFLPWERGEYGWGWDETLDTSIEGTFNELCTKMKEWSDNNYDLKYLDLDLAYPLLYKLNEAGDLSVRDLLETQKGEKKDNKEIISYKGLKLYSIEAKSLSSIEQFIKPYKTIDNYGNLDPNFKFEYKVENHRIIELNLKKVPKLPKAIRNLTSLKVLKLDDNGIKSIPEWIGDLNKLEYLSLDYNRLLALPDSIGNLESLTYISLAYNYNFEPKILPSYYEYNKKKWDAQKVVEYYRKRSQNMIEKVKFEGFEIEVIDGYLDLSGLGIINFEDVKGFEKLNTIKRLNLSSFLPRKREEEIRLKKIRMNKYHNKNWKECPLDRMRKNKIVISDIPPLASIESLIIKECNLTNMEGIKRFINLRELDLSYNKLIEIKGIKNLVKLESLRLTSNKIQEIKEFGKLINLKELDIRWNEIYNIKGLENLKSLKKISISNRNIPDDFLQGMNAYYGLVGSEKYAQAIVDYCKVKKELGVSELSVKKYFEKKRIKNFVIVHGNIKFVKEGNLILYNKEIKSFDEIIGISELPQLIHFELKDSKISEIKSLENHTDLEWLDLSNNQIEEIKDLESHINLRRLHLEKNNISELKGFKNLSELTQLDLSHNKITDIKGLKSLTNLRFLDLCRNKIKEIKGLENLTNLTSLSLNNNNITEIKGLDNLTNLTSLSLNNNNISEIKGLENLENLIYFSFKNNPIFKEFDDELKSREIYLHSYAKTAVDYCKIKKEFILENLSIKDYFYLKDKFGKIRNADPKEIKQLYDDLTEIIILKCGLCKKTFKIRKDSSHADSLEHQNKLKSAYDRLKEPQDPQFQNIYDFKKLSRKYLEERIKSNWGVSFHSITKALLIPENDVQETILVQIQMLKDLLKYKEKFMPSKSKCDNFNSQLDTFQNFIESLDNNVGLDILNNLMKNLQKIIDLFYNQRRYAEERSLENVRYCIITFWDYFKELWEGIIFKEYSTDIQSHIKVISEFFEVTYIFTYRNTSQFVFDSIEDFNERPWDFDPSEYKIDYFKNSIKGRYEKYYRVKKKHYYFWSNSNKWYEMDSWYFPLEKKIKKEFNFKNKISKDPYFSELSCPQCKHINIPIVYSNQEYHNKDWCFKCGLRLFMRGYLNKQTENEILIITDKKDKKYGDWIPKSAILKKYSQSKDIYQTFIIDFTQSKDFKHVNF